MKTDVDLPPSLKWCLLAVAALNLAACFEAARLADSDGATGGQFATGGSEPGATTTGGSDGGEMVSSTGGEENVSGGQKAGTGGDSPVSTGGVVASGGHKTGGEDQQVAGTPNTGGDDLPACSANTIEDAENCGECGLACFGSLACTAGSCEQRVAKFLLGYRAQCVVLTADQNYWCTDDTGSYVLEEEFQPGEAWGESMSHRCALRQSGAVECWATRSYADASAIGAPFGSDVVVGEAHQVLLPEGVTPVELGVFPQGGCVATAEEEVYCWGRETQWKFLGGALGTATAANGAVKVPGVRGRHLHMNGNYQLLCAEATDGSVTCWGQWPTGNGANSAPVALPPTVIRDSSGAPLAAEQVSVGGGVGCAVLKGSGFVECWGNVTFSVGGYGELPLGYAAPVPGLNAAQQQVAVGGSQACALDHEGDVKCWGVKDFDTSALVWQGPTHVDVERAVDIFVGVGHACVRRVDGGASCWGANEYGELGIGEVWVPGHEIVVVEVTELP